jgi:hypothetical protein
VRKLLPASDGPQYSQRRSSCVWDGTQKQPVFVNLRDRVRIWEAIGPLQGAGVPILFEELEKIELAEDLFG